MFAFQSTPLVVALVLLSPASGFPLPMQGVDSEIHQNKPDPMCHRTGHCSGPFVERDVDATVDYMCQRTGECSGPWHKRDADHARSTETKILPRDEDDWMCELTGECSVPFVKRSADMDAEVTPEWNHGHVVDEADFLRECLYPRQPDLATAITPTGAVVHRIKLMSSGTD